jgi:hypothetical protein
VRRSRIGQLMKETQELVSIVTTIVVKCKRNARDK